MLYERKKYFALNKMKGCSVLCYRCTLVHVQCLMWIGAQFLGSGASVCDSDVSEMFVCRFCASQFDHDLSSIPR